MNGILVHEARVAVDYELEVTTVAEYCPGGAVGERIPIRRRGCGERLLHAGTGRQESAQGSIATLSVY
jgi:hypothetical protein